MSELARIETVVFLQHVLLFSFCKAGEILRISAIAEEKTVTPGETVYEEGRPPDALYCVVRGAMTVSGSDGNEARVGPLGTFGVEEILTGRLRTDTAVAESESLLLAIDSEDLFDLLANNVEIVRALFRQLLSDSGAREDGGRQ